MKLDKQLINRSSADPIFAVKVDNNPFYLLAKIDA